MKVGVVELAVRQMGEMMGGMLLVVVVMEVMELVVPVMVLVLVRLDVNHPILIQETLSLRCHDHQVQGLIG
jgi:hypothetical protein